jgi:hypothetical protein
MKCDQIEGTHIKYSGILLSLINCFLGYWCIEAGIVSLNESYNFIFNQRHICFMCLSCNIKMSKTTAKFYWNVQKQVWFPIYCILLCSLSCLCYTVTISYHLLLVNRVPGESTNVFVYFYCTANVMIAG